MPRISALIFGLSLVGGCSRTSSDTAPPDSREARHSSEDDNPGPSTLSSIAALSPTATGVHIDPTLATVCELSSDDDFFVFDDDFSDVRADRVLEAVARCVQDGPLMGRRLQLVTYATEAAADARPQALTRTEGLRGALLRGGVAEDRIWLAAKTGDAEMPESAVGWPNERRVDIRIVPRRSR